MYLAWWAVIGIFALNASQALPMFLYLLSLRADDAGCSRSVLILLSRAGFWKQGTLTTSRGLNKAQFVLVRAGVAMVIVLDGRYPFFIQFLCQVLRAPGCGFCPLLLGCVLAVVMSLIRCFLLSRVVKVMFFDEPADAAPINAPAARAAVDEQGCRCGNSGLCLQALMSLCAYLTARLAVIFDFPRSPCSTLSFCAGFGLGRCGLRQ